MGDIKGVEIHDIAGLSKPLTKLFELISVGIGKVYEPMHIRRMAKAKAEEIKVISATITDNVNLPVEYSDGSVNINTKDVKDLFIRAQNRFLFQEMQKQQNIEAVVAGAYNILEQEENVDEEPVDKDWIIRFFNSVEDVSNDDLQKLWSKILAGEVKHPKSFSMRTLNVLRNISREEALLFEKVCKASALFENLYLMISSDKSFMEKHDIQYGDIVRIVECGLAHHSSSVGWGTSVPLGGVELVRNSKILIRAKPKEKKMEDVTLDVCSISWVGSEIAQLYDNEADSEILLEYAGLIKNSRKNNNVVISAHRIIDTINGEIVFDPNDLLLEG